MGFSDRQVADIAANLPGATEVFRAHKIDFCCGGQKSLEAAAEAKGEHGERLENLEAAARGFALPPEACSTWRALYAGLRKLIDDIHEHVHLENSVLFPRFGG